ncbi:MAG: 1,4-dihydroxy-2-naphthoate octaprenyltransferase [Bacteroidaceae bacterium]
MENKKPNITKSWILASRPKTLMGALAPVVIASALALNQLTLNWCIALICALFAICMQIVANFINDLVDFKKGSDRGDRLGPKRACAQGWISAKSMLFGSIFMSVIASLLGLTLLFWGGWELIVIGVSCILFAFLYSTGPYPLSYYGFGDILVLLFFGFVPVCTTYYLMCGNLSGDAWLMGAAIGIMTDALLILNNYRDIEEDIKSGKRTIIVRMGKEFGYRCYFATGYIALMLTFFTSGSHLTVLIVVLYLHTRASKQFRKIDEAYTMTRQEKGKALNKLLGQTALTIILFAVAVAIDSVINYY